MSCMLRTSTAFTIGMHAAAVLAGNRERLLPVGKIAKLCGVSEAHLAKVVQLLSRAGYVIGERGPAGGFRLTRPPEEISLLDLWDAIEGPTQNNGCPFTIPACNAAICSLGRKLDEHNRQIEDLMKKTTLKDLDCVSHDEGAPAPDRSGGAVVHGGIDA